MLWTLAVFLVIAALLLLQFLLKLTNRVKYTHSVYPSDALIDQALPDEIMEHMMTFLDPRATIECRQVSKYWRYHSIKPRVERVACGRMRQRVREVYHELNSAGIPITNDVIERIMTSTRTKDMFFARASAIASDHGADLIVADSKLFHHILSHALWPSLKKDKRYFMLTTLKKSDSPWQFCAPVSDFGTVSVPDKNWANWNDTEAWTDADILIDVSALPASNQYFVQLYLYRPTVMPKYFHFIPLTKRSLQVSTYFMAPIIVHDILHSSYLSMIKSLFGPIIFIGFLGQLIFFQSLLNSHKKKTSRSYTITYATCIISYVLLTYITYPTSMNVFVGIGVQALMVLYFLITKEYFRPNGISRMNANKWQLLTALVLLILMMVDWPLVVDSVLDLSIFRTLFHNTVCYGVVILCSIVFNFLNYIQKHAFSLRYLFRWDASTVPLVRNGYLFVIWMTLVAPTWQASHL